MKSKDQQLLEEAYARIICEELDRNWKSPTFNKGLGDVIKSGEGTIKKPFVPQIFTDLYLLAGILRDYSKDTNKVYYYEHNGQLYKATGENKAIKVDVNDLNSLSDDELLQLFLAAKDNELGVWPPKARTEEQKKKAEADSEKYYAKIKERGGKVLKDADFHSNQVANN